MANGSRRDLIFFLPAATACNEPCWRPFADVYRTNHGWLVKVDLAGVRAEDLTVQISGSSLTLTGTRRDWAIEEGLTHYSMEISYSHFERNIELPFDLHNSLISSEFRDGMLLIRIVPERG